jgi:hypothetical protein
MAICWVGYPTEHADWSWDDHIHRACSPFQIGIVRDEHHGVKRDSHCRGTDNNPHDWEHFHFATAGIIGESEAWTRSRTHSKEMLPGPDMF